VTFYAKSVRNGKNSVWAARRLRDWHELRRQPEMTQRREIFSRVLNAVWMAVNRKQKSGITDVWIATETHPVGHAPSLAFDRAGRIRSECFEMIRSFGYTVEPLEDNASFVCYLSHQGDHYQIVSMIGLRVSGFQGGSLRKVREQFFSGVAHLQTWRGTSSSPRLVKKKHP
jgi:hypothetical protein